MRNEASVVGGPPIPFSCLPHILEHQAHRIAQAPAILAPGRAPLTFGCLYQHVGETQQRLRAMGIGRHDRVAVSLPTGPEAAVAILAAAASATCAPVNPAYQAEELERYFADLRPDALLTQAGIDSPARGVAACRGLRLIELSPVPQAAAGTFTLHGECTDAAADEPVSAEHVAVVLPTSGTTSRPKLVPQTHRNICASAFGSVAALALTQSDRCLNVVPLFHGHGLHATVLASLAAAASVVCTPEFDVRNFYSWLAAFQPSWYSAVPTVHQAIVAQAMSNRERIAGHRLRFIRSSSAPLPQRLFAELERTFAVPVIEYYGMAEVAASPIACNPLPPRPRKAGSVGVRACLDVAIMDREGALQSGGAPGEIVVRGPSVVSGYVGNPEATNAAFVDGWFKTGDLGYFDADGHLFIVGRASEVINRGGDKIAPREVDEVLLDHPAVAEAVTFATRHPTLGEDVAAAVVLRPNIDATATDIRQFAAARLAAFKVPRQVLFVDKIPKGPTGKIKRIGLAVELGFASGLATRGVAPRTPMEKVLAQCWAEVLGVEQVGIEDDFFVLGGDSLMAAHLLTAINEKLHVEVEISQFFDGPTIAQTARYIESSLARRQARGPALAITKAPRSSAAMPASLAQVRLWKLQHALPAIPFFNILYALRLTGQLDLAALERGINEIVERHEVLRTSFALVDDECVQVVAPQLAVSLAFDDLRALHRAKAETAGQKLVQNEIMRPFDLAKGPLIRARLVRLADHEHVLMLAMHHAVCDGWSLGVFADELTNLYEAYAAQQQSPLPPLAIQYADFAHWQRQWQSRPEIVDQLAYWREQLRDPLPSMRLVQSGPQRPIDDLRTARRAWALPLGLIEQARRFSHEENSTVFMTLVAALQTLLHHYLDQDDVRVATTVANRNRPGTERLIGPLVNMVILRSNLGGDPSAREVMRRVRMTTLAAFANQDLPVEELVQALNRERNIRSAELANVLIMLENATLRPIENAGSKLTFEEANANMLMPLVTMTTFDVILMFKERNNGLVGTCVYKPHGFTAATIDNLLRNFEEVLKQMVSKPTRPISNIRVAIEREDHPRVSTQPVNCLA
jgi:acyl-CoA synthetase (AMP-forming)/AMP-acid ligase II/acyl carrier protein